MILLKKIIRFFKGKARLKSEREQAIDDFLLKRKEYQKSLNKLNFIMSKDLKAHQEFLSAQNNYEIAKREHKEAVKIWIQAISAYERKTFIKEKKKILR